MAIALAAIIYWRWIIPLLVWVVAIPLGAVVGRVAWEWLAEPNRGFEFGSEFEEFDWVVGFASVAGLAGALVGLWLSVRRRRVRQKP